MIAERDSRRAGLVTAVPGDGPVLLSRAPGRVNIIGEHTDYNGLPVLPFAGGGAVLVAARRRTDGLVEVRNSEARFPVRRFVPRAAIPPFAPGDWGNYVKAAVQALATVGVDVPTGGASLMVDGDIPAAAGMSSSSALVVACALAILGLGERSMDAATLAELLARGEQYVGTLSGGMDQAAILLGRAGHALRIAFHPLRTRAVAIPEQAAFIVANTHEEAAKSGAARGKYNQRVVECRVACALLGRRLRLELPYLGALAEPRTVLAALDGLLPETVPRDDLVRQLGLKAGEVEQVVPASATLAEPERFVLRARVRHVLGEAARVEAVEAALGRGDLEAVGALLDESHASAARDYGTSTDAADAVARIGRQAGALGARLMGAGFGGSVLLLAKRERVAQVLTALDRAFYRPGEAHHLRAVVGPSAGAEVARVDCEPDVC
jgi:N-acetylgalactosamine kinase